MILHPAAIWNHSPISQYLPTRFHTSAAGRLTVISIGIETWVGCATTIPLVLAGGALAGTIGVCALSPARQKMGKAKRVAILPGDFSMEDSLAPRSPRLV